MAVTAQNTNNTTIRSEGKLVHLEQPLAPLPYHVVSQAARDAYDTLLDAQNEVACLMLGSMPPELQKALENYRAYVIDPELKTMSVSKLLSLEDEKLLGHVGTPRLCNAQRTWCIPKKAKTPTMLGYRRENPEGQKEEQQGNGREKNASVASTSGTLEKAEVETWSFKSVHSNGMGRGCEELVKRDIPDKLDSGSIKCIFVGYPKEMIDRYGYYVDIEEYELRDLNEPPNYKAALADPESNKWLEAMNTEMQSMKDNQVWYLVDLPSNGRTIGCKWLFKKKTDMDGNIHTFKAHIRAIRILLAIATFYDYEIWQMDVNTAFLNGRLSEDQASRSWNKRFDEEIKKIGLTHNPDKPCVYLKASRSNVAFLVLYADDILLMGNSVAMLQESAYLEKILKKFRMENSKKGYTPMMEKPDYRKSQGAKTPTVVHRMQRVPYALDIGSIMYAARFVFAQNLCSRFQQNLNEIHWTAVKTILKYLRNTKDMDDIKSQTGYVFVLNGGAVDWKSAKQSTTAMYFTEAEYIAAAEASMEVVWMRKFIDGLKDVIPSNKRPMEMLCDNEPALAIAGDPRILKGAIHFQRKYHYIREVIQRGEIVLKKVHTDDNVADPFTKPMPLNKHFEHAMAIGIVLASSLM
ncbi:hypothetical protein Tco_1123748 [Tanacetum coccineum]|uniref:Reverse transcriptase Ty1/copia-type domain-containing protein n=1 Tax=Tanacetum coccineum TaxID=301880 RepID=A0ABQ5J710_9ASTR